MSEENGVENGRNIRIVGLGVVLALIGLAGATFAYFPAPPHSTAPALSGWPARWFATGVGWFGVVVVMVGMTRRGVRTGRSWTRWPSVIAAVLAAVCWCLWLVSLVVS